MAEEKKEKLFEDAIKQVREEIEEKMTELKIMIQDDYLPKTETKLKENVFLTVAISLAIGFFTGIIFSFTGKCCGKKK
ncbi:MAG: hypothetical protein UHW86_06490 [Spirochaetota bacterium]|jgi:ElaB/YqjD/DUF883 family membrane-anchored ribosome-binding protein|nr:hypothetical protein [Spirochaetota bacterium]